MPERFSSRASASGLCSTLTLGQAVCVGACGDMSGGGVQALEGSLVSCSAPVAPGQAA